MNEFIGSRRASTVFCFISLQVSLMGCEEEKAPPPAKSTVQTATTTTSTASSIQRAIPKTVIVEKKPEEQKGPRFVSVEVTTTLEEALIEIIEDRDEAQKLSQVTNRLLVWWVNAKRDVWKGDRVEVVFEPRREQEPVIHALWFHSKKLETTKQAVRYRSSNNRFARYYEQDGKELERRLVDGPIEDYEQITALLDDGRGHRGVDFKAPEGTPVYSPFKGRVRRRNWSRRRNGTCLEIVSSNGRYIFYLLHLSRIEPGVRPGRRVRKGQLVARSGNTGRSSAPHLHYQIERNGRVRNPFEVHKTRRIRLSKEETRTIQRLLDRYEALRAGST